MQQFKLEVNQFGTFSLGDKYMPKKITVENRKEIEVYIFIDEYKYYNCLFSTVNTEEKLPQITGLTITYEKFKKFGSELSDFILVKCKEEQYVNYFLQILNEILDYLNNNKIGLVKSINIIILKWRHFLSFPKSYILDESDIIGLIGELLLLEKILDTENYNAIDFWVAEERKEDFLINSNIIEVKATLNSNHVHIINGIDQLLIIQNFNKYILSIILTKTDSINNINLPYLIDKVNEKIKHHPEKTELFYFKLKQRKYDIRDREEYLIFNYEFITAGYFLIDENFPKLTTNELSVALNNRISKIRYTIDLEGLPNDDFNTLDIAKFI
jgi:hypothetical protein